MYVLCMYVYPVNSFLNLTHTKGCAPYRLVDNKPDVTKDFIHLVNPNLALTICFH